MSDTPNKKAPDLMAALEASLAAAKERQSGSGTPADYSPRRRPRLAGVIAARLWKEDGEPDGHALGEVNRAQYEEWADRVMATFYQIQKERRR